MIVNLPWDTMKDTIEGALYLISTRCGSEVKITCPLYIVKNTLMAKWYQRGQFTLVSAEETLIGLRIFVRPLHPLTLSYNVL